LFILLVADHPDGLLADNGNGGDENFPSIKVNFGAVARIDARFIEVLRNCKQSIRHSFISGSTASRALCNGSRIKGCEPHFLERLLPPSRNETPAHGNE
jgi:hypothetical protein